jgi:tetratricopeptide (TPR) repeat protein
VTKGADEAKLKQVIDEIRGAGREPFLYFDPSQPGHYPQRPWEGARHRPRTGLEELALLEAVARDKEVAGVVVLSDDLYALVRDKLGAHVAVEVRSDDIIFLQRLVESYSGCAGEAATEVAKEVGKYGDNRALTAALAGDWLKRESCRREAVAEALRRAQGRAVDFALDYIWYAVLGGDRKKANVYAPLIVLRGLEGPIPVKLAERILVNLGKSSDEVRGSEVVRWFARRHHSTLKEAIKKAALSPVNREKIEPEELYQALIGGFNELMKSGLIIKVKEIAIDWGRIIDLMRSGLAGDMSQLSEEEKRRCVKRAALVLGHALAAYPRLPRREDLPEEIKAVLGDTLDSCVVDDYMTAGDMVPLLTIQLVALMYRTAGLLYLEGALAVAAKKLQEAATIFSPLVSAANIISIETLKALVDNWRRRRFTLPETFYALGLAALAAEAKVDGETADRLLYAASFAVQEVVHPATVLPILVALRPLGEKAPHRYVSLLAAALELRTLDPETVRYIYDALQKLQDRLEAERLWPLVEAIRAYLNLIRRFPEHIKSGWRVAANMCSLYDEIKERDVATAPEGGLSAQRLLNTIAKAYVLAAALRGGNLAQHVQVLCGLGDLEEEAKDVMFELDWAADHPEELIKIMENDKDFAEWVRVRDVTEDAKRVIEDLRAWFTYVLARYKLNHALDEKKLEETAEEFEKAAEMRRKLEQWGGYLIACSLALRARVFAAKSWRELLERAEGFQELWDEAKKHLKLTARYLATAALPLGECLVYLAASGNRKRAEELLRKWRWLLNYDPRASVNARLTLRLFGVGDGARLKEVVDVFKSSIWREFQPALLMLASRLQKDEALKRCKQLPETEVCVDAVAAATSDQEAVKRLKSKIGRKVPEASLLLDRVDGKTLVEILAPKYPSAQLAFTLLATVEGRADAVRLHGLWGSARSREPLPRQISRAVYENCVDLNSEGCRMALLKLYYYHI